MPALLLLPIQVDPVDHMVANTTPTIVTKLLDMERYVDVRKRARLVASMSVEAMTIWAVLNKQGTTKFDTDMMNNMRRREVKGLRC